MQGLLSDVHHFRAVDTAVVIDLLDEQPVGKGRDVQHVEQRGLAGTNLIPRPDQLYITLKRESAVGCTVYNLQESQ